MANTVDDDKYEAFEARHISQLAAACVPHHLWRQLFSKLQQETFDAGDHFHIIAEESDDGTRNYSVVALNDISAKDPNSIFLIDHAWTFRPQVARQHLGDIPGLLDRVCAVFDIEEREHEELYSDYGGSDGETDTVDGGDTVREPTDAGEGTKPLPGDEPKPGRVSRHASSAGIRPNESYRSLPYSPSTGSLPAISDDDIRINEVLRKMWQYVQTYTIRFTDKEPDESDMPLWYMPDEFGVRIGHSKEPNFRMVPMFYSPQNVAFSLLFPIRDIKTDEVVTRDCVDNMVLQQHPEWRNILMHPWEAVELSEHKLQHVFQDDAFFTGGRTPDVLPLNAPLLAADHENKKIKLMADDDQLIKNLKSTDFELVDRIEDADVVWSRKHFSDYKGLYEKNPKALVNQFPYESVLTVKDLMAAAVQLVHKDSVPDKDTMKWDPAWFQTTFNLNTELPQFVTYFQQRAKKGLDNTWIVKPWNLARGLDMHVTDNLSYIIRLVESGPKIACKYIERPVLFRRPDNGHNVKFDLRYIVFVRSMKPCCALLYNNFWVRFAINDFNLHELDDRETHLTVFNYDDDKSKVLNMKCDEFTRQLETMYPNLKWNDVQNKINLVIKDAFKTLSSGSPPHAFAPNGQSRAMYGVDVMLKWSSDDEKTRDVEVSLIEGNFMPDCNRACEFYPDFADTVFKTLFMSDQDPRYLTLL